MHHTSHRTPYTIHNTHHIHYAGVAQEYIIRQLQMEEAMVTNHQLEIKRYQEDTQKMRGQIERLQTPDGRIMHAEVRIGDSVVMMGEASDDNPPIPAMLHLYLEDADAAYRRALAAGATSLREPEDQFYGDRTSGVQDAFGNQWWLATHIEDVPADEMQRWADARARQA